MNHTEKYMEYAEKYMKMNVIAAKMTGYFGAKAKWDSSIPLQTRKEMLQYLIDVWTEWSKDDESIQEWIKEWEKEIIELSA